MISATLSGYIFAAFAILVIFFQLGLALGAPWGEMAMGGKFPGRFPTKMRVAATVQMGLLFLIIFIVLVRAEIIYSEYYKFSKTAIWFVVGFCGLGAIMNTITPSKKERMLWAPVSIILLVCSAIIALS